MPSRAEHAAMLSAHLPWACELVIKHGEKLPPAIANPTILSRARHYPGCTGREHLNLRTLAVLDLDLNT